MKSHIVKEYIDTGFGFPVTIENVHIANIQGHEVALINYHKLGSILIKLMPKKPTRLTGAEVKFIRQHFQLTLQSFGELFGVTHVAVKKWEDRGQQPTAMALTTEHCVRLWIQLQVSGNSDQFQALYRRLTDRQSAKEPVPMRLPFSRVSTPCLMQ